MNVNPGKVGIAVKCAVCHRTKAPRGRSVSPYMASSLCADECAGYRLAPLPGSLWPREFEADFGYPVEDNATELKERT